ncbi:MAG: BREX-2 system adenine-specific DNA-methyltransferase PglX [Myxococcales bacterium]|nr:BREX-2 system adenine-specific DNA-methyltransferase PglX [Myxococcales bacterium]
MRCFSCPRRTHAAYAATDTGPPLGTGDVVRDWSIDTVEGCLLPYDTSLEPREPEHDAERAHFERYRTPLKARLDYGETIEQRGKKWFEHSMFFANRFRTPLSIAFAFVATHNHFVLDRGGKVFKQSAPVIKLPAGATEEDHLALLGLLNSSTACFWMKQVFHCKGSQGVNEGMKSSLWEQFFQHDSTKMKLFPVVKEAARVVPYTAQLDALARARSEGGVSAVLRNRESWESAPQLRAGLDARRTRDDADFQHMVALQEELDWLCYSLYGLDEASDVVPPDQVEPLSPTWLPWCLDFAARDAANRATIARGEESSESPSVWFERHRWEPATEAPKTLSASTRARIEARRARTRANPALTLIEAANFKRRWYKPDYETEEREALELWLADQVETVVKDRGRPVTLEQASAALQDDARVLAVCEVLTGRRDFSLTQLVAEALQGDMVPNHRFHVYKPAGLVKREAWERTWDDQRREDAGEKVTPEVPPAYGSGDFVRTEYWQLRGKLDVPKERFVAFTEVPGRSGAETLYGWAGWTPLQRVKAMLAMDEELEDAGVSLADRAGLLDSAWRLLPDVARQDAAAATRLRAELSALVGPGGPSREVLEAWRSKFPAPGRGKGAKPKKAAKPEGDDE